jgi:F-type H+-transporting ATPase subunit gamma
METLETLGKRIDTTRDLQSIVTTMKALSAVSIHQYEKAAEALQDYSRTIELGLMAALRGGRPPTAERATARGHSLVVVFGSDHGLCGRFNHELVRFVREDLRERGMAGDAAEHLVAGARAVGLLETAGASIRAVYPLPGTVAGLTQTAYAILRSIDERRAEAPVSRVRLYHNRRTPESTAEPHGQQLWPLDPDWLDRLARQRWPSPALPRVSLDAADLLAALVREQLFIGLFRAGAESAASEHATRLSAMQAAERNIEEHLGEMNADYRRKRQESITEELLDVVSGFEAMQSTAS